MAEKTEMGSNALAEMQNLQARLKEIKKERAGEIEAAKQRKEEEKKSKQAEKEKMEGHIQHVLASLKNRGLDKEGIRKVISSLLSRTRKKTEEN